MKYQPPILNLSLPHLNRPLMIKPRPLHLTSRQLPPQPHNTPGNAEDNHDCRKNDKTISSDLATLLPVHTRIQEGIRVESLSMKRQIGERDVKEEQKHEEREGHQRVRVGSREDDF